MSCLNKLKISNLNQWGLIFIILFIFTLVNKSPVSHAGSDPRASLLLSQTIIENQSIKLDRYKDAGYGGVIYKKNKHYYYYFPIGTSISSIPFVWFETVILNKNMNNRAHDRDAQKYIAGIVSVSIFILLYLIANMYFTSGLSISIAFIFYLSTSLSSTLGQALWSQDFSSLYAFLSLFLTLKIIKENKEKYWVFLGCALFMAYLTRPTLSLLTVTLVLFLFFNNKKEIAIKTASLVGLFLGLFVVASLYEFNQLLPDYYLVKRLSTDTFWTAFYGNLFSPGRGLFIFSPFLLLFIINVKGTYRLLKQDNTLLIILAWIILHLIVISKFPHWWAGFSYGPRFMIDILPAVFLLYILLLKYSYKKKPPLKKCLFFVFFIITIPTSIYFNSIQGLYNNYAGDMWNAEPNIDNNPEYLFNWKYPQFLDNKERHEARIAEYLIKRMKNIQHGVTYKFNAKEFQFVGWSIAEVTHRWSIGNSSKIKFKIDDIKDINGNLNLNLGTLGAQEIKLIINGYDINSKKVNSPDTMITFNFDKNYLIADGINTIEFEFPDARAPGTSDKRILAMALKSISME